VCGCRIPQYQMDATGMVASHFEPVVSNVVLHCSNGTSRYFHRLSMFQMIINSKNVGRAVRLPNQDAEEGGRRYNLDNIHLQSQLSVYNLNLSIYNLNVQIMILILMIIIMMMMMIKMTIIWTCGVGRALAELGCGRGGTGSTI